MLSGMHFERNTLQTSSCPEGIDTRPLLKVSSELIRNSVYFWALAAVRMCA